jgi:hypothetical protein
LAVAAELISAALATSTAVGFASLEMFISFVISSLGCWLCYRAWPLKNGAQIVTPAPMNPG